MSGKRPIAKPFKVFVYDRHELVAERVVFELPLTIGRHSQSDLCLKKYKWVSRHHAVIHDEGGRYVIHDLKSRKGLDYQGQFVSSVEVADGMRLTIGTLDFVFEFEEGEGKTTVHELDVEGKPPLSETAQTVLGIPDIGGNTGARQLKTGKSPKAGAQPDAHTVVQSSGSDEEPAAKSPLKMKIPKVTHYPADLVETTPPPLISELTDSDLNKEIGKSHFITGTVETSQDFTKVAVAPIHRTGKIETNTTLMNPPSKPFIPLDGISSIVSHALESYLKPFDFAKKGKSRTGKTSLESYVTWKGQIYDIHGFLNGEKVVVGPTDRSPLTAPTLDKKLTVATVTSKGVQCRLLKNVRFQLKRGTEILEEDEIKSQPSFKTGARGGILTLGEDEVLSYELGHEVQLHLRKIPASRGITVKDMVSTEKAVKDAVATSTIFHLVILALAFIFAPEIKNVPKLENVPKRYAKLLVKPTPPPTPVPTPTPAPTPPPVVEKPKPRPKPTPKRVVKKRPPVKKVVKKVIRRPKRVVIKRNTQMKTVNQYPLKLRSRQVTRTVDRPVEVKQPEPQVDVKSFGALAALGAVSPANMPQVNVQNVQINQNAGGGQTSINTGQVIGALKAKGGTLPVGGGSMRVATTGKGYGTGTGYGVQGSRSLAGSRSVAGVVGTPKLYKVEDSEGLTQKQVMAVVKEYLGKIQQCYERALLSNPDLSGRVEYEWLISPSGNVEMAQVKKSEISSSGALNSCVVAVFKGMKFPVAKNGQTTRPNIGFPFGRL